MHAGQPKKGYAMNGIHLLDRFRLVTADIAFRLPDHPLLIQTHLWQEFDLLPGLPKLSGFLEFWQRELDGPLVSVNVMIAGPMGSGYRNAEFLKRIH
jgi:uncharacterized protein Usg